MAKNTISEIEEWRPVEGWPYEVSNLGRVRRCGEKQNSTHIGRVLKPSPDGFGYPIVTLSSVKFGRKTKHVHVLVCTAFYGVRPSENHVVCHEDGVAWNVRADNLNWGTYVKNEADKRRHGTNIAGERSSQTNLTNGDVLEIRRLRKSGVLLREIAAIYKISVVTVSHIALRRVWNSV